MSEPHAAIPSFHAARPDRIARCALGFVMLGVSLRLVRYLLRYPLWHDEAFVAVNFIDGRFADLAGPLQYLQVCPLLFLWVELAVVKLLGFNEWTVRLVPTLCSIAGLVLFERFARRAIPVWGHLIATAILAVSFFPIRHGNEVKPYSVDLLAASALLLLSSRWLSEPGRVRWLWLLALLAPIALSGSLTAVFIIGGVGLVLGPKVWKERQPRIWAAYLTFGVLSAVTFLALLRFHLTTTRSEWLRVEYLRPYWADSFPPLADGWLATLVWFVRIHAGNLLAYPVGGDLGGSVLTLACVIAGLVELGRSRRFPLLALLSLPFALNLLAAALGRYPYGGEARIAQHLAPPACLLAGLGAARLIAALASEPRARRLRRLVLGGLLLLGVGNFVEAVASPHHMISAERDREFARWFWHAQEFEAEVLCLKADLGLNFEPRQWITGISASYLCNRAIYGPPRSDPPSDSPDGRPLRFVLFHVESYPSPLESPEYRAWYDSMAARYRPGRIESFIVNADRGLKDWKVSRYWVIEFLPEPPSPSPSVAASPHRTDQPEPNSRPRSVIR